LDGNVFPTGGPLAATGPVRAVPEARLSRGTSSLHDRARAARSVGGRPAPAQPGRKKVLRMSSSLLQSARWWRLRPEALEPASRLRARTEVVVNPLYAELLHRAGLVRAEDLLALPEQILSGHPDRQVSRVMLGAGDNALPAILKREHRVPWSERLRNWLQGFGRASKAGREGQVLARVRPLVSAWPEWIAAGEAPDGRPFLLLREVPGMVSLPHWFQWSGRRPFDTRRLARELGRALARLHAVGFLHGDLYANHV